MGAPAERRVEVADQSATGFNEAIDDKRTSRL